MWFHRFCTGIAVVMAGASLAPLSGRAQPAGEASAQAAEPAAAAHPHNPQLAQRSGLWLTVEAERRRSADAGDNSPHRLSEAQRQELRDQIRRASLREDGGLMAPAVSRP